MKVPINQFKGMFTNTSEVNTSLEYCKYTDAKITPKGLESKTYSLGSKIYPLTDAEENETVLWAEYILLDDDVNSTKYVNDGLGERFENPYVYDPIEYLCIITDSKIKLVKENAIDKSFDYEGTFRKALYNKGKLYITTSSKSYELARYNRETNRTDYTIDEVQVGVIQSRTKYKEAGIYLKPFTYPNLNQYSIEDNNKLGGIFNVSRTDNNEANEIEETITAIVVDGGYFEVPQAGGSAYYWILSLSLVDNSNKEIERINFSTAIGHQSKEQVRGNAYYLLPKNNARITDDDNAMFNQGIEALAYWRDTRRINFIVTNAYTRNDIIALGGKTATLTTELIFNENNGFSNLEYQSWILHTYLLDDGSEIALEEKKIETEFASSSNYFGYAIDCTYPFNLSTKVLEHRIYIKHQRENPYEMIYAYSFYGTDLPKRILSKLDLSGIYLSQTLGTNKPFETTNVLTFDDFAFVGTSMFVLRGKLLYYPSIGNGKITKLFLSENVVPNVTGTVLMNLSNGLAISSREKTQLIHVNGNEGIFIFSIKDEVGFSIKNQYDKVETPDGAILNTPKGIYATNGSEMVMLSTPINDIIKSNWSGSKLLYNAIDKELLYIIPIKRTIYRYSFEAQAWSALKYLAYENFFLDNNGEKFAIVNNRLWTIEETETKCVYTSLLTSLNDLMLKKAITSIEFDYEGEITCLEKEKKSTERKVDTFHNKLKNRTPKDYEQWTFEMERNTSVYGMEINFEINPTR